MTVEDINNVNNYKMYKKKKKLKLLCLASNNSFIILVYIQSALVYQGRHFLENIHMSNKLNTSIHFSCKLKWTSKKIMIMLTTKLYVDFNLLTKKCSLHIKTSQLIFNGNELTGFYVRQTLFANDL